jgi:hypothetical protein
MQILNFLRVYKSGIGILFYQTTVTSYQLT